MPHNERRKREAIQSGMVPGSPDVRKDKNQRAQDRAGNTERSTEDLSRRKKALMSFIQNMSRRDPSEFEGRSVVEMVLFDRDDLNEEDDKVFR